MLSSQQSIKGNEKSECKQTLTDSHFLITWI